MSSENETKPLKGRHWLALTLVVFFGLFWLDDAFLTTGHEGPDGVWRTCYFYCEWWVAPLHVVGIVSNAVLLVICVVTSLDDEEF